MTLAVLIGNSDNRLTQKQWSEYIQAVGDAIQKHSERIYFGGSSWPQAEWQNACWVIQPKSEPFQEAQLWEALQKIAVTFNQESIAMVSGDTQFIRGVDVR